MICKQAAGRLHLSVPEVKNLALSGKIPAVFYGGMIRFVEREIEEWLEDHTELITDLVGIKNRKQQNQPGIAAGRTH